MNPVAVTLTPVKAGYAYISSNFGITFLADIPANNRLYQLTDEDAAFAIDVLHYVFGKTDLNVWRQVVNYKLTPPWPLPHHSDAMGMTRRYEGGTATPEDYERLRQRGLDLGRWVPQPNEKVANVPSDCVGVQYRGRYYLLPQT